MNRLLSITITETIEYYGTFDLGDLEDALGLSFEGDFEGDLDLFLEDLKERDPIAPGYRQKTLTEVIEENGDVQGQTWTGEFVDEQDDPRDNPDEEEGPVCLLCKQPFRPHESRVATFRSEDDGTVTARSVHFKHTIPRKYVTGLGEEPDDVETRG